MTRPVRIANCSGFYGDRSTAPAEMVHGGPIDVLTGDWLAELTLAILAMDRRRDPTLGYARTFPRQLAPILDTILDQGIRVVTNAGGLNPDALAEEVRRGAAGAGLAPRIAVVHGDDVSALVEPALAANAYLGCWGIAEALEAGADIVITGRVTDAAVVIGAAAWWHGWTRDQFGPLAGALVAGHVIECGCHATGGNFSFSGEFSLLDVGFPIAEIGSDGSSVITKHPGTGGRVSRETVTAQLLYEIQSDQYVSPDVVAHLDTIQLEEIGPDRVAIAPVSGSPPPATLKVGRIVPGGFRNQLTALIGGVDAEPTARRLEDQAWQVLGGRDAFDDARSDLFLARATNPVLPTHALSMLTFSVRDADAEKVDRAFTGPLVALALASVPGLTFTTAPGRASPIGVFEPMLLDRNQVPVTVGFEGRTWDVPHPPSGERHPVDAPPALPPQTFPTPGRLGDLVGARSGDKAGNANVGFWVRDPSHTQWLMSVLSTDRVREWLAPTGFDGPIHRTELPNLGAVNIVLEGWLGQGVAANLAPDPQAKCLGEWFRALPLE